MSPSNGSKSGFSARARKRVGQKRAPGVETRRTVNWLSANSEQSKASIFSRCPSAGDRVSPAGRVTAPYRSLPTVRVRGPSLFTSRPVRRGARERAGNAEFCATRRGGGSIRQGHVRRPPPAPPRERPALGYAPRSPLFRGMTPESPGGHQSVPRLVGRRLARGKRPFTTAVGQPWPREFSRRLGTPIKANKGASSVGCALYEHSVGHNVAPDGRAHLPPVASIIGRLYDGIPAPGRRSGSDRCRPGA